MLLRNSLMFASLMCAGTLPALAQKGPAVLEMNADGEIQIAPDGHVSALQLHSQLAPSVADVIDRHVRGWRFEPVLVNGVAVTAKTVMHLSLHAEPVPGKDEYTLRVSDVRFGDLGHAVHMKPPKYPPSAVRAHVGGKVMLAIRVDETGKVVEAQAYQTSLDVRANSEQEAEYYRHVLEQASLVAAREWRYEPTAMINGKAIGSTALVPVSYTLCDMPCKGENKDDAWRPLLPGPVHPAPWMNKQEVADNQALSTLKDGQALSLDSPFHLRDSVIGKTL